MTAATSAMSKPCSGFRDRLVRQGYLKQCLGLRSEQDLCVRNRPGRGEKGRIIRSTNSSGVSPGWRPFSVPMGSDEWFNSSFSRPAPAQQERPSAGFDPATHPGHGNTSIFGRWPAAAGRGSLLPDWSVTSCLGRPPRDRWEWLRIAHARRIGRRRRLRPTGREALAIAGSLRDRGPRRRQSVEEG